MTGFEEREKPWEECGLIPKTPEGHVLGGISCWSRGRGSGRPHVWLLAGKVGQAAGCVSFTEI